MTQRIQRVRINIEAISQDGTVAKVPPAGQTHDVLKRGSLLAEVAGRWEVDQCMYEAAVNCHDIKQG